MELTAEFQWWDFEASLEMWLLLAPLKQQWRYIWKRTVEKSPALSKCDFCCPRWKSVGWKGLIQFPLKGWLAFPNNAHFRYWTQKHIFADMTNIVISHPNSKLSFLAVTWQLYRFTCHSLTHWLTDSKSLLKNTTTEHSERLVTLETCYQSDEKTKTKTKTKDKYNEKYKDKDI